MKNAKTDVISEVIEADYKIDRTVPTGEIRIDERTFWEKFLNTITFGLFYKESQTVTITAADNSREDVTVEYWLTDEILTVEQLQGKAFTAYTGAFGMEPDIRQIVYAKLIDKAGNVFWLCSNGIVLDSTAPVISGAEDGKTYCGAVTLAVSDDYLDAVTLNGTEESLTDGTLTLDPAAGKQTVVETDKAGNSTTIAVTVNDGHTFGEWTSNGDDTHSRECTVDGCSGHETKDCAGGTATCTEKAVCAVCGAAYGKPNPGNHHKLVHFPAKAATRVAEGNVEYWYCAGCGKYYSDAAATKEITLADTVIAQLPDDAKSPRMGDSSWILWIALLFVGGGAVVGTAVLQKKRNPR